MKPDKNTVLSLIEDYAAARATGREALIVFAAARLKEAMDAVFHPEPKMEGGE